MIRIRNATKVFGARARAVNALDHVSLDVGPGVWAVAGPNGAGKSTLLGLILGFLRPTSGTIEVDGQPPRSYVRRRGAAYLPERFTLPGAWPVRGALRALAELGGAPRGEAGERAEVALERFGLEAFAERRVGTLSRGLNQRLGLAQALLTPHDLVVLDEPTEGLDPLWRVRFRDVVAELRGRGGVVLIASHELGEVERIADRVIVLDDGRVADVLDARRGPGGPLRYMLVSDAGLAMVRRAFPDAEPDPASPRAGEATPPGRATATTESPGSAVAAGRDPSAFVVTVADAAELSHRLAALLDLGVTVHAVAPASADLEARVRDRLGDA